MATKKEICKAIRLIAAQLQSEKTFPITRVQTHNGKRYVLRPKNGAPTPMATTNPYRRMKRAVKRGENVRSVIVKHNIIGDKNIVSKQATIVSFLTCKI